MNKKNEQKLLEIELENTKQRLTQLEKYFTDMKNSTSYKIGRATTLPIRWALDSPKLLKLIKYKLELIANKNKRALKDKGVIFIDKKNINKCINKLPSLSQRPERETPKLIISLTSFPERIKDITYNIYSLLDQKIKPDILVLWLAKEQFPNREDDLPKKLIRLKNKGLTIRWCENLKSYTKLVYSLKEYPKDIIVTADDDIFYPNDWLELLYNSYLKNPHNIHCHRAHKITFSEHGDMNSYNIWKKNIKPNSPSYLNFFTGVGGVLYPPNSLHPDVLNKKLYQELSPTADDIWFWAMALLHNTKVQVVSDNIGNLIYINPEVEYRIKKGFTLGAINETANDIQLEKTINYYKELKDIIFIGKEQLKE